MNSRTILVLPYQLTRTPLALVDVRLAQRLPENSLPRVVFDRALGSYDQFAGRLLGDESIVRLGTDRIERSGKIAAAITLEREADERREAGAVAAQAGRTKAAKKAQQAQDRVVDGLEDAEATEREGKQAAAEDARALAARKKEQADARARKRTDGIQQEVRRVETAAEARKTRAQQATKATLSDATEERRTASAKRSDADQLGTLAAQKRQARNQA
jgi:hypothetical protein